MEAYVRHLPCRCRSAAPGEKARPHPGARQRHQRRQRFSEMLPTGLPLLDQQLEANPMGTSEVVGPRSSGRTSPDGHAGGDDSQVDWRLLSTPSIWPTRAMAAAGVRLDRLLVRGESDLGIPALTNGRRQPGRSRPRAPPKAANLILQSVPSLVAPDVRCAAPGPAAVSSRPGFVAEGRRRTVHGRAHRRIRTMSRSAGA